MSDIFTVCTYLPTYLPTYLSTYLPFHARHKIPFKAIDLTRKDFDGVDVDVVGGAWNHFGNIFCLLLTFGANLPGKVFQMGHLRPLFHLF